MKCKIITRKEDSGTISIESENVLKEDNFHGLGSIVPKRWNIEDDIRIIKQLAS